jgi:broad specificity phosphatase PhoE
MPVAGSAISKIPEAYLQKFQAHRPVDHKDEVVFQEMMAAIEREHGKLSSPRRKRHRCGNTPGGSKRFVPDGEPKRDEKQMLERVEKALDAVKELPKDCCRRNCMQLKHSLTAVRYKAAAMAALPFEERNKRLEACVSACRVDQGPCRQEFHFRVPGADAVVCRKYFCFYHGISEATLGRMETKMKETSRVIPSERAHGNRGRWRPGKGRQDCAEWMQKLFADVAEPKPNRVVVQHGEERTKEFLPSGIFATFDSVFQYYLDGCRRRDANPVSFPTFRRAWIQHHFQVSDTYEPLENDVVRTVLCILLKLLKYLALCVLTKACHKQRNTIPQTAVCIAVKRCSAHSYIDRCLALCVLTRPCHKHRNSRPIAAVCVEVKLCLAHSYMDNNLALCVLTKTLSHAEQHQPKGCSSHRREAMLGA